MEYKVTAIVRNDKGLHVWASPTDPRNWNSVQLPHPAGVALDPGDLIFVSVRKIEKPKTPMVRL